MTHEQFLIVALAVIGGSLGAFLLGVVLGAHCTRRPSIDDVKPVRNEALDENGESMGL